MGDEQAAHPDQGTKFPLATHHARHGDVGGEDSGPGTGPLGDQPDKSVRHSGNVETGRLRDFPKVTTGIGRSPSLSYPKPEPSSGCR